VKIVSISPYMPFAGIAHAGGELYRRHVELLVQQHDLLVVSPGTVDNQRARDVTTNARYRRLLLEPRMRFVFPGRRWIDHFIARTLPFIAVRSFRRALVADQRVVAAIQSADRI
jgi:hypothetical protein